MGTPEARRRSVNLSDMEEIYNNLTQAYADQRKLKAYITDLENRFKKRMGTAEQGHINGVLVMTYAKTDSYSWAKFAEQHGDLADKYRITVAQEVLDKEALLRDHPTVLAAFQSRQFLKK